MAVRTRRLTGRRPTAAGALATVLLVAALVGGTVTQRDASQRARSRAHDRAETDLARFGGRLDLSLGAAELAAARAGIDVPRFRVAAADAVATGDVNALLLTDATGRNTLTVVGSSHLAPVTDDKQLATAVAAARTTGQPRLAAPVRLEAADAIVIVVPVHDADAPLDLAARRNRTAGFVMAVSPIEQVRNRRTGQLWPGADVEVHGPGGRVTETSVDDPVLTTPLVVAGGTLTFRVEELARDRPIVGWVFAGLGAVAAAVAYAAVRRQQVARRRAEDEVASRSSQLELIAETSAELQQSLDLAELLPAFCVTMSQYFDLGLVAVFVADDEGNLIEAFRLADGPAGAHRGEFDLRRGWRTVGRLVTSGRRPLDDLENQSLQALGDLLAVAVSNSQLYQREQQAVSRLSELDALKNAFLGTVSHELRTSTTAVMGFGELLTDHWDALPEERRRELAGRIRRQAGSLRHLVDDLLDYARLEHESLRVSPRQIDLSDLVRQLADSMSPLVAGHEIAIEADDEVTAYADPIAVERILANLLSNAGKYSPAGTVVRVAVSREGDRARMSVADQGPGIPAEERRRVFVRFYRLTNDATVRTRGAGIGLAILHDFAQRSNATVTIDDAPGGGALIVIDFPTSDESEPAAAGLDTAGVPS